MKALIVSLLFILTYSSVHSAKTYTITIRVTSLITGQPLKGMVVLGIIDKGGELNGTTDENGMVVFRDQRAKSIDFTITDPNWNYKQTESYIFNPEKEDQENDVAMRYTAFKEQELITSKKKPVQNTSDSTSGKPEIKNIPEENASCDSLKTAVAEYPGGMKEMMHFLMRNVEYPQKAIEDEVSGKVYLRFIVEENGAISNIEVVRSVSPEIDEEAIRVIAYMPDWIPAKCDGVPFRSTYMFPLKFSLQ